MFLGMPDSTTMSESIPSAFVHKLRPHRQTLLIEVALVGLLQADMFLTCQIVFAFTFVLGKGSILPIRHVVYR
jgi:hypothetical protein